LAQDIALAKSLGAEDIRVNQQQVNANGEVVGGNKPDLQFTLDGERYYIEYDNVSPPSQNRGYDHYWRILSNDPLGNVILRQWNGPVGGWSGWPP
jgi:hypothetical protein